MRTQRFVSPCWRSCGRSRFCCAWLRRGTGAASKTPTPRGTRSFGLGPQEVPFCLQRESSLPFSDVADQSSPNFATRVGETQTCTCMIPGIILDVRKHTYAQDNNVRKRPPFETVFLGVVRVQETDCPRHIRPFGLRNREAFDFAEMTATD